MSASESRATRLWLALAAGSTTAVALYAVLRVIQWKLWPEANPALVIWSAHAGYFWRSLICGYAGGMIAFAVWILSARSAERVARVVAGGVFVATALLVVQSLFVP